MAKPINKRGQKGFPRHIQMLAANKSAEGKTCLEIAKDIKDETGFVVEERTVRDWISKISVQKDLRLTIQELINKELIKSSLKEELNCSINMKRFLMNEFFKYWSKAPEGDKSDVRNLLRLVENISRLDETHLKILGLTDSVDEHVTAINEASKRLDEKLGLLKEESSEDKNES